MSENEDRWPKSGPTEEQEGAERMRVAAGGEVDWDKVPTERQDAEWQTLRATEALAEEILAFADDYDHEMTMTETQESIRQLRTLLLRLTYRLRDHLKAVDLDDVQKIAILGAHCTK